MVSLKNMTIILKNIQFNSHANINIQIRFALQISLFTHLHFFAFSRYVLEPLWLV